jgi:hypothetical protein
MTSASSGSIRRKGADVPTNKSYLESCTYYKSAEGGEVKEDKYALDKT